MLLGSSLGFSPKSLFRLEVDELDAVRRAVEIALPMPTASGGGRTSLRTRGSGEVTAAARLGCRQHLSWLLKTIESVNVMIETAPHMRITPETATPGGAR